MERRHVEPLSLAKAGTLTFEDVDNAVFPAIELARKAMLVRSGMSIVLNAADETAVQLFLSSRCSFADITRSVAAAMEHHLCELRAGGETGSTPYCLSEQMLALSGRDLEQACWQRLDSINALTAQTADFVKEYAARGGNRSCS